MRHKIQCIVNASITRENLMTLFTRCKSLGFIIKTTFAEFSAHADKYKPNVFEMDFLEFNYQDAYLKLCIHQNPQNLLGISIRTPPFEKIWQKNIRTGGSTFPDASRYLLLLLDVCQDFEIIEITSFADMYPD